MIKISKFIISGSLIKHKNIPRFSSINRPFFFTKQKPKKTNYVIVRATREDFDAILDLMRRSYYREEPTVSSVGAKSNPLTDNQTIKALSEGLSLVAKCKVNGDILGACINESINPWDPDLKDKLACIVQCPKTRKCLHFYAYMQRLGNIWDTFGVMKVFEMTYLFTRKDQRGKGLGKTLLEQSRLLAADCGYNVIRCDATSAYTAKICEKMGMTLFAEIPYAAYVDAEEKPIFRPIDPHVSAKIYVQQLSNKIKK